MSFKFGAFSGPASTGGQPSSSAGGGGGLYAGIALGAPNVIKKVTDEQQPASISDSANLDSSSDSKKNADVQVDQASSKDNSKKDDDKSKASTWSSSLRFAPVIRKQPTKSASKPFAVPFSSTVSAASKSTSAAAAFAPEDDTETTGSNPSGRAMHIPGRAKAALTAPASAAQPSKAPSVFARKGGFLAAHAPERIPGGPQTASVAASATQPVPEKVDSSIPGFQHSLPAILAQTTTLKALVPTVPGPSTKVQKQKLDQPPPLTLPDDEFGTGGGGDVNGFAQSEAGRKLALRAARNSKKSKKKGKAREVDPAILFMEDYDPARPNDYHEWTNFDKRRRDMRREALRLERERQRRKEREEKSESSYYSSDDNGSASDDAQPGRANFFAPPPDYNEPSAKSDADQLASSTVPVPPMARAETGDEAYARRVALSQGIPYYQPPQPVTAAQETNQVTIGPSMPPEAPASSAPMVSIADAQARAKAIAERLQKLHGSNNEPAAPSTAPETTSPASAPQKPLQSAASTTMLEAQAKAKLIAAKLAALNGAHGAASPSSGTSSPTVSQQPGNNPPGSSANEAVNKAPGQPDFARRLMDKYGWKEGQGLGPNESGRTSILTVAPSTANTPASRKRKDNPGEGGVAGSVGPNKVGAMGKGRGMVVDETRTEREMEEKAKFGEPTRVVYLTNVVAVDEVDDELAMEIAEEARKHGIVERCFVRVVQRPVEDPSEAVRVFLLYSGLVGAWKAVKTFDGRFFGGRNIRARFFSENAFTLGDWDV